MKLFSVILMVLSLSLIAAHAEGPGLIVTKSGKIFAASKTRTEGNKLYYVSSTSKKEVSITDASVEGVIPTIERGKEYSKEDATDALEVLNALRKMHPHLQRQLNALENDWKQVQNPSSSALGGDIEKLMATFKQRPKDARLYKNTSASLGMISYKDKSGRYDTEIKKALKDLRFIYLGFDLDALVARGAADPVTREDLKSLGEEVSNALKSDVDEREKALVEESLIKGRATAIRGYVAEIDAVFIKYNTVSVYHKAVERMRALKKELVVTDADSLIIENAANKMFSAIKEKYSMFDFSHNLFPIGPAEMRLLRQLKPFSSLGEISGVKEECYMLPARLPRKAMSFAKRGTVPFIMLFNRDQPKTREFNFVLQAEDADGGEVVHKSKMVAPVENSHGRAGATLYLDFPKLPEGAQAMKDDKGEFVRVYLAARTPSKPGANDGKWIPITKTCRIPVATPEEKE
jgi:hypothetical protein